MDIKNEAKRLFTSTTLEEKRVKIPHSDPRAIGVFKDLESVIAGSFHKPIKESLNATEAKIPSLNPPPVIARHFQRTLQDQELLKKLIQYRGQIPLSNRIIRKKEP